MLGPVPKDGGQDPRTTAAMNDGKDEERLFIRGIGNKKIVYARESQRPICQVRPPVTLMGKRNKVLNCFKHQVPYSIRRTQIILRNEFPKLVKVRVRLGVQNKAAHARLLRRTSLFFRRRANASSPSMGFTVPLLTSS